MAKWHRPEVIIAETGDRIVDCAADAVCVHQVLLNSRLICNPGAGYVTHQTDAPTVRHRRCIIPRQDTQNGVPETFHVATEPRRELRAPRA